MAARRRIARPKAFIEPLFYVSQDHETIAAEYGLFLPSAANWREHWRARASRVQREHAATSQALTCLLPALLRLREYAVSVARPLRVQMTRIAPVPIRDSFENLPMCFKGVKDAFASLLRFDDGDDSAATWVALQEKRGRQYGVRIEVTIA